jgi:hypothetical protein
MSRNVPRLCVAPQAASVFPFEKLSAEIDLPQKGLIWPTLKTQLLIHKDSNGGAIYNSLRWAARYGIGSLLQNTGIRSYDNLRLSARDETILSLIDQYSESIQSCSLANGCGELEALEIILRIGAQHGEVSDWQGPDEKAGRLSRPG